MKSQYPATQLPVLFYRRKASLLIKANQLDGALAAINEGVKLFPNDAPLIQLRAWYYSLL